MRLITLTRAFLSHRPLSSGLNITLFALAVAALVVMAKLDHHVQGRLSADATGIDMVVGAKGSPLQIILSVVYHVDSPTGNIPLKTVADLSANKKVKTAVPISMGDSYQGYRIVGSTTEVIDLYKAQFAQGQVWQQPLQAVLGAEVAEKSGLKPGDTFYGSHGLVSSGSKAHTHDDHPYTVVGILDKQSRVSDRLIFTSLESVWAVHGDKNHQHDHDDQHHEDKQVTAVLVQFSSPFAAMVLPREINQSSNLLAALPALEIARLVNLVGVGMKALQAFGLLLLIVSALSLFVMLVNAMQQRKYDLAVLRTLGASRLRVSAQVLSESFLITTAGLVLGLALGYVLTVSLVTLGDETYLQGIEVLHVVLLEYQMIGLTLGAALLASLIPAWQAYRTDVHKLLMKG